MKKNLYRGIEPIIAVVILVAVTLVIAIGVIGWIMGWWGSFGATESLKIYPDSYIDADGNKVYLHLRNEGSGIAVIYKIEVSGFTQATAEGTQGVTPQEAIKVGQNKEVTISPGAEGTLVIGLGGGTAVSSARYQVTIYTRAGNVISATVQAR